MFPAIKLNAPKTPAIIIINMTSQWLETQKKVDTRKGFHHRVWENIVFCRCIIWNWDSCSCMTVHIGYREIEPDFPSNNKILLLSSLLAISPLTVELNNICWRTPYVPSFVICLRTTCVCVSLYVCLSRLQVRCVFYGAANDDDETYFAAVRTQPQNQMGVMAIFPVYHFIPHTQPNHWSTYIYIETLQSNLRKQVLVHISTDVYIVSLLDFFDISQTGKSNVCSVCIQPRLLWYVINEWKWLFSA